MRVQERAAGDGRFLSQSLVGTSCLQSARLFAFSRRRGRFAEVPRDQTVAAFVCKVGNGLQSLALVAIGCVAIANKNPKLEIRNSKSETRNPKFETKVELWGGMA
jgi:hypothetical protein